MRHLNLNPTHQLVAKTSGKHRPRILATSQSADPLPQPPATPDSQASLNTAAAASFGLSRRIISSAAGVELVTIIPINCDLLLHLVRQARSPRQSDCENFAFISCAIDCICAAAASAFLRFSSTVYTSPAILAGKPLVQRLRRLRSVWKLLRILQPSLHLRTLRQPQSPHSLLSSNAYAACAAYFVARIVLHHLFIWPS